MSKTAAPVTAGDTAALGAEARALASALPALQLAARQLAASVSVGVHGRRRAGAGEDFWQYRQALPGDALSSIDWRRSARSDMVFIREMEQTVAENVALWADQAAAMQYASDPAGVTKGERARVLALALALLLDRGGERVALSGSFAARPGQGPRHMERIAAALLHAGTARGQEYGLPPLPESAGIAQTVLFSDFLAPEEHLRPALEAVANSSRGGVLVRILDAAEAGFPFRGRVVFESPSGQAQHETFDAAALRGAYRERLAARGDMLAAFARTRGWTLLEHRTDRPAQAVLLSIYAALGGK